jgi:hypothetical protein
MIRLAAISLILLGATLSAAAIVSAAAMVGYFVFRLAV